FEDKKNLDLLADFIESNVDIDNILSKSWMPELSTTPLQSYSTTPFCGINDKVKIGVAYDEAFCFYYKDNLDALKKLGADLVFFRVVNNNKMPDIDGLYIGGGYPELYAKKLEKSGIRMQIKYEAQNGMPIYAECGGLIYLCKSLDKFKMADVLPAEVSMTNKLQALGYTIGEVINDNAIAKKGFEVRGHEFHYSRMDYDRDATFAYQLKRGKGIYDGKDGLIEYNVMASYMHVHSATFPFYRFLESCREFKRR
ncbi:MAG: cobyrinic acid a,c-diamide synthase, partial [Methanosarcinales archaeon]